MCLRHSSPCRCSCRPSWHQSTRSCVLHSKLTAFETLGSFMSASNLLPDSQNQFTAGDDRKGLLLFLTVVGHSATLPCYSVAPELSSFYFVLSFFVFSPGLSTPKGRKTKMMMMMMITITGSRAVSRKKHFGVFSETRRRKRRERDAEGVERFDNGGGVCPSPAAN